MAEHLSYSDCKIMTCVYFLNVGIVYMFGLLVNLESAICMANKELLTYYRSGLSFYVLLIPPGHNFSAHRSNPW